MKSRVGQAATDHDQAGHAEGDLHQYMPPVCKVCGVQGTLVLSVEPRVVYIAPDEEGGEAEREFLKPIR